jgi:hypothetical protein
MNCAYYCTGLDAVTADSSLALERMSCCREYVKIAYCLMISQ